MTKKRAKPAKRPRPKTYELIVRDGEGSGRYPAGKKVKIRPTVPKGKVFGRWTTYLHGVIDDLDSATTVVTMPAEPLVVKALFNSEAASPTAISPEPSAAVSPTAPLNQGGRVMTETRREGFNWTPVLVIALLLFIVIAVTGWIRPMAVATPASQPTAQIQPTAVPATPTEAPTGYTAGSSTEGMVAPATPAATSVGTETVETFTYLPGGEGFGQTATDVVNPADRSGCIRVWQATNLENLPWTFVLCNFQTSQPAPKMQWPHPTQFTVSGSGTVEFELWRDLHAVEQLRERNQYSGTDPYDVANVKDSPLGLGWFAQGFNGQVCVNDVCQPLDGGGVFQLGFPRDMAGFYHVVITVDNGQVQFWQGEKLTTQDNWPLPE